MTTEKSSLRKFLSIIRADQGKGVVFRVFDGEEWAGPKTSKVSDVLEQVNSTGADALVVYKGGQKIGSFDLVWGNAEDGSELVADYGVNEFTDRVWNTWFAWTEGRSERPIWIRSNQAGG